MSGFEPGSLVRLAPGVQRLLAPNPSLMTGPGTNTYLLGDPPLAVLDPGPLAAAHLERMQAAAPALAMILVTHTHADHSAAAMRLAQLTGARLIGRAAPADPHHDRSFRPDVEPAPEARFELPGMTLRAIATPGHASNHVCYLIEEQGLLFSGDHILDGVTPVIMPPDGVMGDYLDSLADLRTRALRAIAPGHGRLLTDPLAVIDAIVAHRARREAKVLRALGRLRSAHLDALLALVYDDVPPALHAMARCSLSAHLLKLQQEGRCRHAGGQWSLTGPAAESTPVDG